MSRILWPFGTCPSCGVAGLVLEDERRYRCGECGLIYFHNVAVGAGVMILRGGELLLLRRGREPGRGLYTIPGGFVDPGESAEEAVVRECREEIAFEIDPGRLRYLTSAPNRYLYGEIPYTTCDLFYYALLDRCEPRIDGIEATEALFIPPREIDPADLAFPSTRFALKRLIESGAVE